MPRASWLDSKVVVVGAGAWGTVLAQIAARNVRDVRLWVLSEEKARAINSTRINKPYMPELVLSERIHAYSDLDRIFEGDPKILIWALPSEV